jgi:large subunit ribosomal protein L25
MEFKLLAQKREKNERLSEDFIPAVLYGKGIENVNLKIKKTEITKIFASAGESNLITLDIENSSVKVLVKDIQRDVMKHTLKHLDFYQVNMKEKINTEIPLHFIGESKAVRELGGMLMKDMDTLEIECLPNDLVDHIDVDISVLDSFEAEIRMQDIKLPKGIVLLYEDHNEIVVSVKEPKVVEEEPEVVAAPVAPTASPEAGTEKAPEKK